MARISLLITLCSYLFGTSRAAALGSAEDYASGAVHAQIMALKMIDLYHFLFHADLGSSQGQGSSSWGWTPDGKLIYLGHLPPYDPIGSRWREIRDLRDYAVIGSEAINGGIQIFDMKKLPDLDPESPTKFTNDNLTGHWNDLPVGRTHNIVVNEELNYAMAVGSVGGNETIRVRGDLSCRGGIIFINMTNPSNPVSPGCAAGDGYVHDAQCLVYYVTDKVGNMTNIISITSYPAPSMCIKTTNSTSAIRKTHITAVITKARDEQLITINTSSMGTRTNLTMVSALTVLDIRSVTEDPSGDSICEAGFFDIHPEDDELEGEGTVAFLDSWSSYSYFKSGFIFVHTIERGSFVVKMTSKECPKPAVCNSIEGRLEQSSELCANFLIRQNEDVGLVPDYARTGCASGNATQAEEGVARVSSACACMPTTRPPVPTVLRPKLK
ncbi:hypothetical protein EK21DRAFT_96641 [Setomelanomma holmii]|uniref:Uncharacterized protein n=1 Tax=Setomelanomma holmii TaxID=210430 RepID=A0A9P4HHY0_9PLEO|nr:hypothetical protein EK21DRAFT_96641 [Setomelanomma holmii]